MIQNILCQFRRSCFGLGVGVIPMPEGARKPSITLCHLCFADASRLGFFCVYDGENEEQAAMRHDVVTNGRHAEVVTRRAQARASASAARFGDNNRPNGLPSRQRPALGLDEPRLNLHDGQRRAFADLTSMLRRDVITPTDDEVTR